MESIMITNREMKRMPTLPNLGQKKNIKKFSETEILKCIDTKRYQNLERKYDLSEELSNRKELVLPKWKVKNQYGHLVGAIYDYLDYPCFEEENTLDLKKYILRHKKMEELLKQWWKVQLINTDFLTYQNFLVHENQYYFIDYEDMQIKNCPTQVKSGIIPTGLMNHPKYLRKGLFTYNFIPLSQIVFFLQDVLSCSFLQYYEIYQRDFILANWYLDSFGILECKELHQKIKLLFQKDKNLFLEETLDDILENYQLIQGDRNQRVLRKK